MTSNDKHDVLVKKVGDAFKEYGFFVEDREGEILKYLRQKYTYWYDSRPDLVCSSIKSLDTFTDIAIEAKTFESIKQKMSDEDKKQLREINSVVPTYLLIYKIDYDALKAHDYFNDTTNMGLGIITFDETTGQIQEICKAKLTLNNIPSGNINTKHDIYQVFTSKKMFKPNHPHGVLFTKNNLINLINWNQENVTISHDLDVSKFDSESWAKFKQEYIEKIHEFLADTRVNHKANCFWNFGVGVAEASQQVFGYDLPSFVFAVEKIILSHDTSSGEKTKIILVDDKPVIESWHNTHFEFFIWGNPDYYSRPHLLAIKGKIDFISRRGEKSNVGSIKLESAHLISNLIHTNYIQTFSNYKGININYPIGKEVVELAEEIQLNNAKFVHSMSTFSNTNELESAYFIANCNGTELGVETPYPEVIEKLFCAKESSIKLSCQNKKINLWDLEGEGIIEFIRVDK